MNKILKKSLEEIQKYPIWRVFGVSYFSLYMMVIFIPIYYLKITNISNIIASSFGMLLFLFITSMTVIPFFILKFRYRLRKSLEILQALLWGGILMNISLLRIYLLLNGNVFIEGGEAAFTALISLLAIVLLVVGVKLSMDYTKIIKMQKWVETEKLCYPLKKESYYNIPKEQVKKAKKRHSTFSCIFSVVNKTLLLFLFGITLFFNKEYFVFYIVIIYCFFWRLMITLLEYYLYQMTNDVNYNIFDKLNKKNKIVIYGICIAIVFCVAVFQLSSIYQIILFVSLYLLELFILVVRPFSFYQLR